MVTFVAVVVVVDSVAVDVDAEVDVVELVAEVLVIAVMLV